MNTLQEIAHQIGTKNKWQLIGHAIPDGDCIGSLLGLYLALLAIGKEVKIYLSDPVPPIYLHLSGVDHIQSLGADSELSNVIYLDCSDEYRVGEQAAGYLQKRFFTINIDHHVTNNLFGDLNYVDSQAAATAEIIFELVNRLQVITSEIAQALLTGLIMDTGRFMFSSTTARTMKVAAQLLECGADIDQARLNLFESKPREEVLLLRQALGHLGFANDGKIAYMLLPYEEVKMIGALDLHPEGIIDYTRSIQGVEVGLLFRETDPGVVKVGFRSKGTIDVAKLAASLGGGGHQLAAGTRVDGDLDTVKNRVLKLVQEVMGSGRFP
ncbi:DHH family phosphoesterase [Syntrophomonas erecta]